MIVFHLETEKNIFRFKMKQKQKKNIIILKLETKNIILWLKQTCCWKA